MYLWWQKYRPWLWVMKSQHVRVFCQSFCFCISSAVMPKVYFSSLWNGICYSPFLGPSNQIIYSFELTDKSRLFLRNHLVFHDLLHVGLESMVCVCFFYLIFSFLLVFLRTSAYILACVLFSFDLWRWCLAHMCSCELFFLFDLGWY